MITASCVSGEAETNASLLNLAYFYNQTYVVQSIGMKLLEKERRAKVIKNAFTLGVTRRWTGQYTNSC